MTHPTSSVGQEPNTGRWYWYDETWQRCDILYPTRREAVKAQNEYARVVLGDDAVRNWYPNIGDYVWYEREGLGAEIKAPAQVTGEAMASNDDWWIRTLTGPQKHFTVRQYTLEPMTEMEVIALAASWGDAVIL
jgi:hypothetical protein